MRLQDRPRFRASASVDASTTSSPRREAVRALAQSGLYPTNCRLLDAERGADTRAPAAGDAARAGPRLRVGRPRARRLDGARARALPRPRRQGAGGRAARRATTSRGAREGAAGAWRQAFLRRALPARRARAARHGQRDLRDRDHLGPLRRASTRERDGGDRGRGARGSAAPARSRAASRTSTRTGRRRTTRSSRPGKPGAQLAQWDEIKARGRRRR